MHTDDHRAHPVRGYLYIAAAAFFWGLSASLGRAAFNHLWIKDASSLPPIGPLILAQMRVSFSFLVLLPLLFFSGGTAALQNSRKNLLRCLLLGTVGLAASNYFYYLAIQKTNVATAVILQYTAPIWVLLYMVLRGKQKATLQRVGAVVLAVVGAVLAIGVRGGQTLNLNLIGLLAAQGAALSFSFYNIYGRDVIEAHAGARWKVILYTLMAASLFWLFVNPPWKIVAVHYAPSQWVFMFIFAITSMLLPFSFYFAGLHHLDPTRAIVTSCLEPIFAIFIAALTLGEHLGWLQSFGVTIVLAATIIVQWKGEKEVCLVEPVSS